MKLIKIEEVINGRTISRITDKSNDNGVNTESSIPSNIKGEDTKEENEVTVVETPKKPKKNELFPFGRKISFIILGVLIILSVSIAYLCTGYDYGFDRYTDSSVSYQGYARGLNVERIMELNKIATDDLEPDITIVFDVETEIAINRVGEIKDRLEQEGIEFHKKLRAGYLELAKKFPQRIKVVNANLAINEVFEQVKKILEI